MKKIFRKTLGVIIALTVIMGVFNYAKKFELAAGNYHDTVYEWRIDNDMCETTELITPSRAKLDYTSAYIYNKNSQDELKGIKVLGVRNGYVDLTYKEHKNCKVGEYKYLPNLVKERGYAQAALWFDPGNGFHNYIYILWSPDSI